MKRAADEAALLVCIWILDFCWQSIALYAKLFLMLVGPDLAAAAGHLRLIPIDLFEGRGR
ncbi:MAG: hypothetical protein A2X84_00295 [Desulfuromonadaceae bacterium GWC2_58_13]|nr:MAG: hypothetical protein A2X84_00295 [Desulfuromonadaceae bacterium GWC2_58_13]